MAYHIEVTDTFNGEANYCWVRRYLIDDPKHAWGSAEYRRDLIRRAKAAAGWTGQLCTTSCWNHDEYVLRPRRVCHIMFITSWDGCDDHFTGEDLRQQEG